MSCARGESAAESSSFPCKSPTSPQAGKSPTDPEPRSRGAGGSFRFILDVSNYYVILAITIRGRPVEISAPTDRGYRLIRVFEGKKTEELRLPRNAHPESSAIQQQPIPTRWRGGNSGTTWGVVCQPEPVEVGAGK